MKKITAFFMALFPFLVIGILFATGLITKNFSDKTVQRLEMKQDVLEVQKEDDGTLEYAVGGNVRVIPDIARDPTVFWTTKDTSLATVEKETGKMTINPFGYGDIKLDAVAKTNAAAKAQCTVKVFDTKIHKIDVVNKQQAEFMSQGSSLQLQVKTIPSEKITDPTLTYEVIKGKDQGFDVTPTGIIMASATANGEATVRVSNAASGKYDDVTVKVGDSVNTIGFTNDGDTLIQETSYNLFNEVITAPYTAKLPATYFTFESSDPINAPISTDGVITFKNDYIPGQYITFTVRFAGLDSISATKRVASSLNYYSDIAFKNYSSTLRLDLTNPVPLDDKITYDTYPVNGDTSKITMTSSNKDVIDIVNNKPVAKAEGSATLTVQAKMTEHTVISDKIDVTILDKNRQSILNIKEKTIDTNYYALRNSLLSLYENKKITWTMSASDVAVLDDVNETIVFLKNGTVDVKAEYKNNEGISISDTLKLTCNNAKTKSVAVDDGTVTIAAGDVVTFTKGGSAITLPDIPSQLKLIGTNQYVAAKGSTKLLEVKIDDTNTFNLAITEPMVGFVSADDWTHYTTNAKELDLAEKVKPYPLTSTYTRTTWTGSLEVYTPEVEYSFTPEDESAIDASGSKLTFNKPTTVGITATFEDITKNFSATSYCGRNGKFSLTKDGGTEPLVNGCTITLAPGDKFECYIDKYYLSDVALDSETLKAFSVRAISGDTIVQTLPPALQDNKIWFEFDAVSSGKDLIEISNGTFTFYINVTVEKKLQTVDLYCLGNILTKNTNKTITTYSKDNLFLDMNFAPAVSFDEKITIKFNSVEWESLPGLRLNLSEGSTPTAGKTIAWQDGENKLTISRVADSVELASYTFVYSDQKISNFQIAGSVVESEKNMFYLPAKQSFAVMEIFVEDAVFSQDYFAKNFTISGWDGAKLYGQYIIGAAPDVGATKDIKVSTTAKTTDYTISRDLVSKIELPGHNNLASSDQKGLQKVHVYGNRTQQKDKAVSDYYELEIKLYDAKDQLITDATAKQAAISTLHKSITSAKSQATVDYDKDIDRIKIKFDSNKEAIYGWQEMFDNAFAKEENKNQVFSICTNYGKYHPLEQCYAFYSFVVVNAVNVYDDKGIAEAAKLPDYSKNIVLQTNFGVEGKEATPFTLKDFRFDEVYGNGYTICFDSIAKLYQANKGVYIQHGLNIDLMGCLDSTFPTLKDKCMHMDTSGGLRADEEKDTIGYCKFHNFYQDMTIWAADDHKSYTHIKNTMFYNEQEYCRVALSISNPGNTTLVEDCVFFNCSKIAIMSNKQAVTQFKGNIDVYNFRSSDMFDGLERGPEVSEMCWALVRPILASVDLLQSTEYGAPREVCNSYLLTTLGGTVQFYSHTDASGKDVFIEANHGFEQAANYLKYGAGIPGICYIWSTVRPPLPLQFGHSPAYSDEFVNGGEYLNYEVRNLLLEKISRY